MSDAPLLGYSARPSFLHSLTGTSKLLLTICLLVGSIISFDTRFLALEFCVSLLMFFFSGMRLRDFSLILWLLAIFMLLNNLLIFLFAPDYGSELYGTRHLLLAGPGGWDITSEQLFYQLNVTLKYFAVMPPVVLFIATTQPSEFAASLNRLGLPYRISYAVALTLRYIPDVQRDFHAISQAQQARGLDISRKAPLRARLRNGGGILFPLLLGSFERIEVASTAMELRGFGRGKRRTWYSTRPLRLADWLVIAAGAGIVLLALWLLHVNGSRFYNPFL
ncbi:energy-coupling factor transporter transmembrane protein EcfT [Dermabacteraceae bacterium TAE3-ERU5]|nr:energy-coupling factor transporter transmembrane protein EcfT [Dermabacteraceae bacterium TAE3-ERU5]